MKRKFWLVAAALLALAPASLRAQSVEGTVLDRATRQPVAEAAVSVLNEAGRVVARTQADSAGRFTVKLEGPGAYRLQGGRIGYRQVTSGGFDVGSAEAVQVNLFLSAGAVDLDPLTITSRPEPPRVPYLEASGFYARERTAMGVFMRREAVQKGNRRNMSDVLVNLPGVRRTTVAGLPAITLGRAANGRPCAPGVVIDGQQLINPEVIDNIVHVPAIEALEVYRGPSQTPSRFASADNGCGVVVIWTQRRI
jgi:hypothetical protein